MEEAYSVKMAKSASYNFTSIIVTFIISALTSIIAARIFGPEIMGVFGFVIWVINTSYVFIGLGLPSTTQRYVAEFSGKGDYPTIRGMIIRSFKIVGFMSIIIAGIIFLITFLSVKTPDLRIYLIIALFNLPFGAVSAVLNCSLLGMQRFDLTMKINIFNLLLNFTLVCIALFTGLGLIGVLVMSVISSIIALIVYFSVVKKVIFFERTRSLSSDAWRRMIKYALSFSIIVLIDAIIWQRSEVLFIKIFRKASEVAFYSIPFGLTSQMMIQLPAAIIVIVVSATAFMYGKSDIEKTKKIYYFSSKYLALLALPICAGGIVIAHELIGLLYGLAYLPAARILQILLISGAIAATGGAGPALLYGTEKQNFVLKYGIIVAIYTIAVDIFLITRFGAIGAALGNSSAQIMAVIICLTYVCYFLKFKFPWLTLLKITFSAILMGLIIFGIMNIFPSYLGVNKFFEGIRLFLLVGLGVVIYLFSLILFKAFEIQDVELFKNLSNRISLNSLKKIAFFILNFIENRVAHVKI